MGGFGPEPPGGLASDSLKSLLEKLVNCTSIGQSLNGAIGLDPEGRQPPKPGVERR